MIDRPLYKKLRRVFLDSWSTETAQAAVARVSDDLGV